MRRQHFSHRWRFAARAAFACLAAACLSGAFPAVAADSGRILLGHQLPPDEMRMLSELLTALRTRYQPDLGTKAVVLPGASGMLAIQTLMKSAPDGATALIGPGSLLTVLPLSRKLPFDPATTLVPVAAIGIAPLAFVVGPAVPAQVRTMAEYVAWVRVHPNANSYGVWGLGDIPHYIGTQVSRKADLPLRAVGYKGTLALMEDVASGAIPAGITVLPGAGEISERPSIRFLGVVSPARVPDHPDLPTLVETGFVDPTPGMSLGVFVPAGTPASKITELASAVRAATATPAVMQAMAVTALQPWPDTRDSYAVELTREHALWKKLFEKDQFNGFD